MGVGWGSRSDLFKPENDYPLLVVGGWGGGGVKPGRRVKPKNGGKPGKVHKKEKREKEQLHNHSERLCVIMPELRSG